MQLGKLPLNNDGTARQSAKPTLNGACDLVDGRNYWGKSVHAHVRRDDSVKFAVQAF